MSLEATNKERRMMNAKQAANELQSIRNDLFAMGEVDRDALRKRCDAVGMWLATQCMSKKISMLTKEAHDTFVSINQGRCR